MTENIMNELQASLEASLVQMTKAKDLNERKVISETIRNLTESMTLFLNAATDLRDSIFDTDFDMFDDEEDDTPFLR